MNAPTPKPASIVAAEIPDEVYTILADMDFLFDNLNLTENEKLRYMGLFMYMRIQSKPHAISEQKLVKVLSALQAAHQSYRQRPKKEPTQ